MVMRQVCQYRAAIYRFAGGIPPAMIVPGNEPAAAGKEAKKRHVDQRTRRTT